MRPHALAELEARVLEVEVALDAAHGVVGDVPGVAEAILPAARLEHLVPAGAGRRGSPPRCPSSSVALQPRREAAEAEAVELAQPLAACVRDPSLVAELVEVLERRPGGRDAGLVLLALDLVAGPSGAIRRSSRGSASPCPTTVTTTTA